MPQYLFRCDKHGEFEGPGKMSDPPKWRRCDECSRWAPRIFTVPNFTEDRQRFFRNQVDGSRHSFALGKEMPESRREFERELATIGAEPVTRGSEPTPWKENRQYMEHIRTGGERDQTFEKARHPASKAGELTVLKQLKSSGVRIG